jgi:hypothetical protein
VPPGDRLVLLGIALRCIRLTLGLLVGRRRLRGLLWLPRLGLLRALLWLPGLGLLRALPLLRGLGLLAALLLLLTRRLLARRLLTLPLLARLLLLLGRHLRRRVRARPGPARFFVLLAVRRTPAPLVVPLRTLRRRLVADLLGVTAATRLRVRHDIPTLLLSAALGRLAPGRLLAVRPPSVAGFAPGRTVVGRPTVRGPLELSAQLLILLAQLLVFLLELVETFLKRTEYRCQILL